MVYYTKYTISPSQFYGDVRYTNMLSEYRLEEPQNATEYTSVPDAPEKTENAPPSFRTELTVTAVKTAFFSVVAVALALTLFVFCFPYTAMRFYLNVNNRHRALECAESYLTLHADDPREWDSRTVGVLYRATDLADKLFSDETRQVRKEMYATKAVDYTAQYFRVSEVSRKNAEIDAYYLTHSAPHYHVSLYSVADHLTVNAYKANVYLGNADKIVWYSGAERQDDLQTLINTLVASDFAVQSDDNMVMWATVLNQLTAYVDVKFAEVGADKLNPNEWDSEALLRIPLKSDTFDLFYRRDGNGQFAFTALYERLTAKFGIFSAYAAAMPQDSLGNRLRQAFCVKAVGNLQLNMMNMLSLMRAQAAFNIPQDAVETWKNHGSVSFEGNPQYQLPDLARVLGLRYQAAYAQEQNN